MGLKDDYLGNLDTEMVSGTGFRIQTEDKPLRQEHANGSIWLDQAVISTGNTLLFDNPIARSYPDWNNAGLTGNITLSATGAVIGGKVYVKHSDSQAFADPAEVLNPTDISYQEGTDNFFEFVCVSISPFKVYAKTLNSPSSGFTDGQSASETVTFTNDINRHGVSAAITADIVINPGSNTGRFFYMRHNAATPPAISGTGVTVAEMVDIGENYIANQDNLISGIRFSSSLVYVTIAPAAVAPLPTAFNLAISGIPAVGNTLSASWSHTGSDGTATLQWYRSDDDQGLNRTAISGAVATTYDLQAADELKYIDYDLIPYDQPGGTPGNLVTSPRTTQVAAASSFHPLDLAVSDSMLFMFDFTDETTVTTEETTYGTGVFAIEQIEDLLNAEVADRIATANRPLYITSAGAGNHKTFGNNAAFNSELTVAHSSNINLPAGSPFTVFLAFLPTELSRADSIMGKGSSTSDRVFEYKKESDDGLRITVKDTGGDRLVVNHSSFFDAAGENIVISHVWNNTIHKLFKNGSDVSATSSFNTAVVANTDALWLGSMANGASLKGELPIAIMFAAALDDTKRAQVENWITTKLQIP